MYSPSPSSDWKYLLAAGLCAVLLTPLAWADNILVITDSLHPVYAPAGVRIIELDRPDYIKARLATHLPTDPARSTFLVQQRLKEGGTALQQQLGAAYQDVVDAWTLGITKIPAVVVDRRFVIYGEPDTAQAVIRIEQYRRTQP